MTGGGKAALALVVHSGEGDRIHYAFVMAAAAAAMDIPVTFFATGPGLAALGAMGIDDMAADERRGARGVATLAELRGAAAELGVRFIACDMGLRDQNLSASDLDPGFAAEIAGFVTLLNAAGENGRIVFI